MLQEVRDQLDTVGTDLNAAIEQLEQSLKDLGPLSDTWCGDIGFVKYDNRWSLVYRDHSQEQVLLLVNAPIAVRVDSVVILSNMRSQILLGQQQFFHQAEQAIARLKILVKMTPTESVKP